MKGATRAVELHDGIGIERCEEILAIVSHELRSPLLTITTCAHALQRSPADAAALAHTIAQSAAWSLRLINDLLDVAAVQTGRLQLHCEPTSLRALLELSSAIFLPVAAATSVSLTMPVPHEDVTLLVDSDRLLQAVGNLVANAIRATPAGGSVRVVPAIRPRSITLRVEDDGPGISAERLARLFDREALRRDPERKGTGLGLAIARGILAAHGGRLTATSVEGRGSVFTCRLPRAGGTVSD